MSTDAEKIQQLHQLLHEAYKHYFDHSDGYCKSSEGHISVEYGNYWERHDDGPIVTGVNVYSYVLGPNRHHQFDNLDQAIHVVTAWRDRALKTNWNDGWGDWDDPYLKIEAQRQQRFDELMDNIDTALREARS